MRNIAHKNQFLFRMKNNTVHVAVGVIKNKDGQYLIAKRREEAHQGGLWEFPGGKIEKNESVLNALKRELKEEVGISLLTAEPLIKIQHDYGDKSVLLDVFKVENFSGKAFGQEGQLVEWVYPSDFHSYLFPNANHAIIKAIQLPDQYMITGEFENKEILFSKVESAIKQGIKLIQFRAHHLIEKDYFSYAKQLFLICSKKNSTLLLNTSSQKYKKYQAYKFSDGIHLNSKELELYSINTFAGNILVAASCHNKEQLSLAEKNNLDFIVLSPVNKTSSHPNTVPMGWEKFQSLLEYSARPVFALGGMIKSDLKIAKKQGAQGIAAIGEFWNE